MAGIAFALGLLVAAPEQEAERHVVLVTTDGLRWEEVFGGADADLLNKQAGGVEKPDALKKEFWRPTPEERRAALLPFFWEVVAKEGQVYGNARQGCPVRVMNGRNFSYPGYNEMLCGAPDPRIDSNDKKPNSNVTVLEWLNGRPGFKGRVAAFCSWDVFPWILNRDRSGVAVNAGYEPIVDGEPTAEQRLLNALMEELPRPFEGSRLDGLTFRAAMEHLRRHKPRVLYLAFDDTDSWAHAGKYDQYLHAARRVDGFLRTLWTALQSMPEYKGRTSLVLTTDHGRGDAPTGWKTHGEKVKGAEFAWLAVLGPDTPARGEMRDTGKLTQSQVAATVAALVGEDFCSAAPQAARPVEGATGRRR
jgi:hypothetical protein